MRRAISAAFVVLVLALSVWFGWRFYLGTAEKQTASPVPRELSRMDPNTTTGSSNSLPTASWVEELTRGTGPIEQRISLTHGLRTNCSTVVPRALLDFLVQSNHLDGDQYGQYLKNRVMDELCELEPVPAGLAETLITIFEDSGQHPVLRDYAVQHLASLYEQLRQTTAGQPSERETEKTLLREALWKAAEQSDESFAGTALLGLEKLSAETTDFDREQVAAAATRLAAKEAVELNRISALQVMALLKSPANLPLLLQTAKSGETTTLRLSAIGALGKLESSEAIPTLAGIVADSHPRLSGPAQIALERINQKNKRNP